MILDGHIHIENNDMDRDTFLERLKTAGVDGGVLLSLPPDSFASFNSGKHTPIERLENLFKWVGGNPNLYPFYWIDPLEADAQDQVKLASEYGVKGFKVICDRFYPGDEKAIKVFKAIANVNKPILFHSGILWDGKASSSYNRPSAFEPLLNIDGLKFSLAHVSWPWYDENIAVYGKFLNAYSKRPDLSVEMFIDITPGTPPIYRREVLAKLFTVGYDIENNVIFGTDSYANNYNCKWVTEWIERDNKIYKELSLKDETINNVYSENLLRFLGLSKNKITRRELKQGE